jgi:hypothetical protein
MGNGKESQKTPLLVFLSHFPSPPSHLPSPGRAAAVWYSPARGPARAGPALGPHPRACAVAYLFGCIACLFPLMVYCLAVAWLNQRRTPTLVPGSWDAAGTVLGLSGFLALGGPTILQALREGWRAGFARDGFQTLRNFNGDPNWPWLLLWWVYIVAVLLGATWAVRARARTTSVYNVDPAVLEGVIARVLDGLGLTWQQRAGVYHLAGRAGDGRGCVFETESFPIMSHVTLRWSRDAGLLRREIEMQLAKELDRVETPPTPVAGWFLTAATSIFVFLLGTLALIVIVLYRYGRGY